MTAFTLSQLWKVTRSAQRCLGLQRLRWAGIATTLFVGLFTLQAHGAVLLRVDVTDPLAVVITSTTNAASASGTTVGSGIDLADFLPNNVSASARNLDGSSTLRTAENNGFFGEVLVNDGDLNLSRFNTTFEFASGNQAFTGSATYNHAMLTNPNTLPSPGATGDITFFNTSSPVFGQWLVVPEPRSVVLLAFGSLALLIRRKMCCTVG